ncbi:unnamed protein product [Orchesella dallaii]|uniref:Uncharacterized protein n=1 Tax=Orchesella dallaii TaxID=48710 RepID=A0ABP1RAY6_9HEXA
MQEPITSNELGYRIDEMIARGDLKEGLEGRARTNLIKSRAEFEIPRFPKRKHVNFFMKNCFYKRQFRRKNTAWVKQMLPHDYHTVYDEVYMKKYEAAYSELVWRRRIMGHFPNDLEETGLKVVFSSEPFVEQSSNNVYLSLSLKLNVCLSLSSRVPCSSYFSQGRKLTRSSG